MFRHWMNSGSNTRTYLKGITQITAAQKILPRQSMSSRKSYSRILKDNHSRQDMADNNAYDKQSSYDNMKYDFAEDELLREMLQKVIYLSDITIEIIGAWLWISGNTYHHRKELKELGFKFASQKKCWYWHSESFRKKSHRHLSMDDIRDYYGSTEVESNGRIRLEA